jgi:hypothetical protein
MVSKTDGHEIRSALCDACDSRTPLQWSNAAINSLLDLVDCPKDERDPLAMKQAIFTLQPELSSLKLKQRKAVQLALEAQLQAQGQLGLSTLLRTCVSSASGGA